MTGWLGDWVLLGIAGVLLGGWGIAGWLGYCWVAGVLLGGWGIAGWLGYCWVAGRSLPKPIHILNTKKQARKILRKALSNGGDC